MKAAINTVKEIKLNLAELDYIAAQENLSGQKTAQHLRIVKMVLTDLVKHIEILKAHAIRTH